MFKRRRPSVWFASIICIMLIAPAVAEDAGVHISRTRPETVYLERRGDHVRLNFDIELANPSARDAVVNYIELKAFDAEGRILTRRQMGGNGLPGPIEMLPSRIIPAGGELYLFNPFPDLSVDGVITRVTLDIFHDAGRVRAEVTPAPVPGPTLARPPLDGAAFVYSGNDLLAHHRRVALNSEPAKALGMERVTQRFALDFTMLDPATGDLYSASPADLARYPAFGAALSAPVDGEVVAVRADMPDNTLNANGAAVKPARYASFGDDASLGNYIVIRAGEAFIVMSHFAEGSIRVAVGDRVRAGDPIGRLGFSGDTAYPHLHVQMQDGPDALSARPLPIVFDCVRLGQEGGVKAKGAAVDSGDFVRPCETKKAQ
ncbi:MAG: peptidoglycan DD-metalloendopeptidase family protein [Alphaproteobacteria bacterium]|nr:peptidoglycan DD-metalloendopeptidase family protein [Alphaproteobacteria bacterium]